MDGFIGRFIKSGKRKAFVASFCNSVIEKRSGELHGGYMKWMLVISLCFGFSCFAQQGEAPNVKKNPSLTGLAAKYLIGESGGDRHFYVPTRKMHKTPAMYQLKFEEVRFKSGDGTELFGWFMPGQGGEVNAKSTIVFSHGNSGSIPYHLPFVNQFVKDGYNVFLYDYRGYGHSAGKPEKEGIIKDVVAAFKYVETRAIQKPIFSIGHSLGGAKSVAAVSLYRPKGLRGVIVVSAFNSYRDIAEKMMGVAARKVISDTYNPEDIVSKFNGMPLLVAHGEKDRTVPFEQGKAIYAAANEPKKLVLSKTAGHVNILHDNKGAVYLEIIQWMARVLKTAQ